MCIRSKKLIRGCEANLPEPTHSHTDRLRTADALVKSDAFHHLKANLEGRDLVTT